MVSQKRNKREIICILKNILDKRVSKELSNEDCYYLWIGITAIYAADHMPLPAEHWMNKVLLEVVHK